MNTLEIPRPLPTSDFVSKEQWHELAGCGFSINSQIRMLKQLYYQGAEFGQPTRDSLDAWVKETNLDIKGFVFEYLQKGLVLPNPIAVKNIDGEKRIAGKNADRPLLESISSQERFGSVKRTFALMEERLLSKDVKPGSMMVMTSPDGWSGLKNDEGEDIIYPDSQTIAIRKNESGELESFTFVTDMDFGQNKTFLKNYGVSEDEFIKTWDEKDRLADITSKTVFLDGSDKNYQFEDVVDALKKAKNSSYARGSDRFDLMYKRLSDKEKLSTLSEDAETLIAGFEDFVLNLPPKLRNEHFEMVGERLAKTILQLSGLIRGGKNLAQVQTMDDGDYAREHRAVAAIGGCGGGGYMNTAFGGRSVEGGNCPKIKCGRPGCGWEASDAEVTKIQKGELKCCPDCGWKP